VLHLTTRHPALDVRIFQKECRGLAEAGYEVLLAAPDAPAEARHGVRFERLASRSHGPRPLRIASRLAAAFGAARRLAPDVLHLHDPELIPVGLALAGVRQRVVYDVHEDTPREALTVLPAGSLRRALYPLAWRALEGAARRRFDAFVCATPAIAAQYPEARTVLVRNFPRLDEFDGIAARTERARARGALVYVGGLTEARGARVMLDALAMLPDALAPRLVLVGSFEPPRLGAELARHPAWPRVEHRGFQQRAGVVAALAEARVGLVLLEPTPEYRESLPVKLFEYMAAGIAVVASDFPLWRSFVEDTGAGLLVDPRDPAAIAAALRRLLEDPGEADAMGARGAKAVRASFSWAGEQRALVSLYARLAASARPSTSASRAT
jgi:hypothetical protein